MRRICSAVAVLGLGLMLAGATGLTSGNYELVRNGMTLDQVKALLGEPTATTVSGDDTRRQWTRSDGAKVEITFRAGKVVGKSAYTEESALTDWKLLVAGAAAAISLVSVAASIGIARSNAAFNERLLRRATRYDFTRLLMEVDRILIDKPQLWAVYDAHKALATQSPQEAAARERLSREALIFMFLNLFSTVFDFYANIASKSEDEIRQRDAWDLYLEEFIAGSSEARAICERPDFANLYSDEFVAHIDELIKARRGRASFDDS